MKKWFKWFTLIELLISITISTLVIYWFSQLYINISDSIAFSQRKIIIYNDVKDFMTKLSYSTVSYSSWFIISSSDKFDTLVLTNSWNENWYLLWVFDCNNKTGINLKLASNNVVYDSNCFWYFPLKKDQINNLISDSGSVYTSSFNAGIIYENLLSKSFTVKKYLPNNIFEINLDFFDKFYTNFVWENTKTLNYDYSKIIHINLNF